MDRLRDMFKVMPRYGPTPLVLRIIRRCTLRIYWTSSLIHLARDSLVPQALFPFAPGCTLPWRSAKVLQISWFRVRRPPQTHLSW